MVIDQLSRVLWKIGAYTSVGLVISGLGLCIYMRVDGASIGDASGIVWDSVPRSLRFPLWVREGGWVFLVLFATIPATVALLCARREKTQRFWFALYATLIATSCFIRDWSDSYVNQVTSDQPVKTRTGQAIFSRETISQRLGIPLLAAIPLHLAVASKAVEFLAHRFAKSGNPAPEQHGDGPAMT